MPSHVFRPRLPIDPFGPQPWRVRSPTSIPHSPPHAILVLGAPTHADIAPLATSPHLANSLLVIATHTPPPVPPSSRGPSVIILHLPEPLHVHDSGALRLVSILERAQRVAHAWRTAVLPQPRVQQLAELYPGGEFSISEEPEFAPPADSLRRSPSLHESSDCDTLSTLSTSSSTSSRVSFKPRNKSRDTQSLNQPQFSALINVLPSGLPDKALLKTSILVTTLSTSFLAPPSSLASPDVELSTKSKRRTSIFASLASLASSSSIAPMNSASRPRSRLSSVFYSGPSDCSHSASSLAPSVESLALTAVKTHRPHLIHILPYSASLSPTSLSRRTWSQVKRTAEWVGPANGHLLPPRGKVPPHPASACNALAKTRLVQSIEEFLLSFAYPPSTSPSASLLLPSISPPPPSHTNSNGVTTRAALPSSPLAGVGGPNAAKRNATTPNLGGLHSTMNGRETGLGSAIMGSSSATAIPFLLPAGALGSSPVDANDQAASVANMSIAELVMFGALDAVAAGAPCVSCDGEAGIDVDVAESAAPAWPRAWISRGADVEVVCPAPMRDTPRSRFSETPGMMGMSPTLGGGSVASHKSEDVVSREESMCGYAGRMKHHDSNEGGLKPSRSVKMSRAGLPTPPDSDSSADGGSARSHGSGSSEEIDAEEQEQERLKSNELSGGNAISGGNGGEKRKLSARMSNLFVRRRSEGDKGQGGAIGRLMRAWGVSRVLS